MAAARHSGQRKHRKTMRTPASKRPAPDSAPDAASEAASSSLPHALHVRSFATSLPPTSRNPLVGRKGLPPPTRPSPHLDHGPKRPADRWPIACRSARDRQWRTLPTIDQSGLAISPLITDTAHGAIIAAGWSPKAIASRSLARPQVRMCQSSHFSTSGRNEFKTHLAMRTRAFSATPMTAGLRCQAAEPLTHLPAGCDRRADINSWEDAPNSMLSPLGRHAASKSLYMLCLSLGLVAAKMGESAYQTWLHHGAASPHVLGMSSPSGNSHAPFAATVGRPGS